MDLKGYTVEQLSEMTAAKSAAPGGGSVSAMAGAFAASLAGMVAKLTDGKKGYEAVSGRMRDLDAEAEKIRVQLLDHIQLDASSFDAFMAALALPRETDGEKTARTRAMQEALKQACEVPLETAGKALEAMRLALECVRLGNANAASDGYVGVLMGRAAVLGALSNVRINLGGVMDEGFVQRMASACDTLEEQAKAAERDADEAVGLRI